MRKQAGQKRSAKVTRRAQRKKQRHEKIERRVKRQIAAMPHVEGTFIKRVGNRVIRASIPLLDAATKAEAVRPRVPVGGVIATADMSEIAAIQKQIDAAGIEAKAVKASFKKSDDTYMVTFADSEEPKGWVRKHGKLWQASQTGESWWGEYQTRGDAAAALY